MKSLEQLKKTLHARHLAALNLYRFVGQPAFQEAYKVAKDEEKEHAAMLIEKLDEASLKHWTKTVLKKYHQYEMLDSRYLRDVAQDAGVRGYANMTRTELVLCLIRLNGSVKNVQNSDSGISQRNANFADTVREDEGGTVRQTVQEPGGTNGSTGDGTVRLDAQLP